MRHLSLIGPHRFVHEPPVAMVRLQTIKCHFVRECRTNVDPPLKEVKYMMGVHLDIQHLHVPTYS